MPWYTCSMEAKPLLAPKRYGEGGSAPFPLGFPTGEVEICLYPSVWKAQGRSVPSSLGIPRSACVPQSERHKRGLCFPHWDEGDLPAFLNQSQTSYRGCLCMPWTFPDEPLERGRTQKKLPPPQIPPRGLGFFPFLCFLSQEWISWNAIQE